MPEPHRQLLDLARSEARRRRHATTEPEHLLAVVLDVRTEAEALHGRGLDPLELRDRTEARLADLPTASAYRDATDAPPTPAVERILARCTGRLRFLVRRRPMLVEALLLEPAVARLVIELRRGQDHRYIAERARALAIVAGHGLVGLEHVFRAIVDLPSFAATLRRAGGSVDTMREYADTTLATPHPPLRDTMRSEPVLARLLDTSDGPVTIRELCIQLAGMDESAPFWEAASVTRAAFLHAIHVP